MQNDPKTGSSSTNFRVQSRPNPYSYARSNSQVHQWRVDADIVHPSPFFPQTTSTSQGWDEYQITHPMEKCTNPGFEHSSSLTFNSIYPYRTPTAGSQHVLGFGSGRSTPHRSFGSMIGHDGSLKRSANPQFIQHSAPPKFNPSFPYGPATEFQHKYGYGYEIGRGSASPAPPCFGGTSDQRIRPRSNHWDHQPKSMTDSPFRGTFRVGSPAWSTGPSGPEQSEVRPVFKNIAMQGCDVFILECGLSETQLVGGDDHYCHPFHPPEKGKVRFSSPHELNLIRGLEPKLGVGDETPSTISSDATESDPNMTCLNRDENGNEVVNSRSLDLTLRL